MKIEQLKPALLEGHTMTHPKLAKGETIKMVDGLIVSSNPRNHYVLDDFDKFQTEPNPYKAGWSYVLKNKTQEKRLNEIVELREKCFEQGLELAELDITLKSKDLQLQQVVQELQAVESNCQLAETEKIAYRNEALSQSKRIGDLNKEVDTLTTTSDRAVLLAAIFGIIAIGEALAIYFTA